MKPTREQVLQWAREAGFDIDDDGKLYLAIGNDILLKANYQGTVVDGIKATAALAYEAGRAAENEACAEIAFNAKTYLEAAAAIRARREQ